MKKCDFFFDFFGFFESSEEVVWHEDLNGEEKDVRGKRKS